MKINIRTVTFLSIALSVAITSPFSWAGTKKKPSTETAPPKTTPKTVVIVPAMEPAEANLWKKASDPLDLKEIHNYLAQYPKGRCVTEAKEIIADEQAIDEIESKGVGDRFVVPKEFWPQAVRERVQKDAPRGRSSFSEIDGRVLEVCKFIIVIGGNGFSARRVPAPCGDRSVYVFQGAVDNIVADSKNSLRLVYLKDKGLIVFAGKGTITGADGKVLYEAK